MCRFISLSLLCLLAALGGCSSLSPYSDTTKLDLSLVASDDLNPDLHGRPSPIVVRLLELKNPSSFNNADFFSLYQRPKASLRPDLVSFEELEVRPGETRELKLSVQPGSRYVGVVAAYRDLPEASWRYVVSLQEGEINQAGVRLDKRGLQPLSDVQGED
ncbi:type VI secretion system-associated lipoprotein [Pseudomonas alcaligenes]|uniref:Type VI secretion system-associated lipoprotein n=1 Tax=Aquipseudomonas alcaligenes TaxID=43263 RepID=A0ABR7RWV5_AQUAC|nr:type VI secretion system lipoprotein TssJ [Pseudomonas alcaligenes]MBC9248653.1 type VI secretion system-associated lipoprotein [Pseudomonas alcaligenes]